jgi:hypothetical protein
MNRLPGESTSAQDELAYRVVCSVCGREVPLSEAVVPEVSDYMPFLCGLECYAQWRTQAERFLESSTSSS